MQEQKFLVEDPVRNDCIPIGCCSNCCEPLQPIGARDPPEVPSYPVYELTSGEEALKINAVLQRVFRLAHLRDLNENELEENVPLCPNCANILSQLDNFFQEFDRVRRFDSYLSAKINRLDEIIESGIACSKLQLQVLNEDEDAVAETVSKDIITNIKAEPIASSTTQISASGPWVVLERLKLGVDFGKNQERIEEELDTDPLHEESTEAFQDVDFEPIFVEEDEPIEFSDSGSDISWRSRKRRVSKRKTKRPATRSSKRATEVTEVSPAKRGKTELQLSETDKKASVKTVRIRYISKKSPKKTKARGPRNAGRREEFLKRKAAHPFPCYYCQEDFDEESARVEHLKETHVNKYQSVICSPCGKLFASENSKKKHDPRCGLIGYQKEKAPFICEDCGKEFKIKWGLQSHQRNVHSDEKPYACDQCEHRAKNLGALTHHKKFVHIVPVPVECPECHRTLKSQPVFEDHFKRMHTAEGFRRYKILAKRVLAKKNEENRRKRIVSSFCAECNIDFQTVARYRTHRSQVHVTTKKWQCEQCGKGFNNSYVFKCHIQFVHTDERPYICDQCGISFKSPKNLQTHLDRVHTEGGRSKYNEYNRVNYVRKKKLAQELSKTMNTTERPGGTVSESVGAAVVSEPGDAYDLTM